MPPTWSCHLAVPPGRATWRTGAPCKLSGRLRVVTYPCSNPKEVVRSYKLKDGSNHAIKRSHAGVPPMKTALLYRRCGRDVGGTQGEDASGAHTAADVTPPPPPATAPRTLTCTGLCDRVGRSSTLLSDPWLGRVGGVAQRSARSEERGSGAKTPSGRAAKDSERVEEMGTVKSRTNELPAVMSRTTIRQASKCVACPYVLDAKSQKRGESKYSTAA